MSTMPEVVHRPGQRVMGFEVKAVFPLPELQSVAYELEHVRSGARLLHVHTDDAENLFSITFRTPPPDDTGVPHILEHAVLAGSKKFPVREPFFEMVKMSMATFINAMTGPDLTYYPVASNNHRDLFNLAEVYFDAVFHPLLTEQTFQREAHHLAPANPQEPSGELTVSGIVYSEMKGAYSDPETALYRHSIQLLLPDTIYGRDSGGDPKHIPDLTYERLKRFHRTLYHPSNAFFFLYGDIPTREYLAFLKDKLDAFERSDVPAGFDRQPRWSNPRRRQECFPVGPDEPTEARTYITLNWLVGDGTDPEDVVALDVLDRILLGHEGAPLKKAIIDSRLGEDLILSGFRHLALDTSFHAGLKGTEPDRVDAFEQLVLTTLERLSAEQFSPEQVEAAFQQAAYAHLEIGSYYPLRVMQKVLCSWPYGAGAEAFLRMGEHLERCRERYRQEPGLFNRLIRERLLENPHRLTLVLAPDPQEQARQEEAFRRKMQAIRDRLGPEQLREIAATAEALERTAAEPNPPEAVATLPQLKVADLPEKPRDIPTRLEQLDGVTVLRNDVFANGFSYLVLDFDLTGLPEELHAYLPRYCDAVRKLGAAGMNYEQIARRVAAHTGGINCLVSFQTHAQDPARSLRRLSIAMKALDRQIDPALRVLEDLLFGLDPRDADRLRDVVVQARAFYRTALVQNGLGTAMNHAARGLSLENHLSEIVNGLPQLSMTKQLAEEFQARGDELMGRIEAVRDFLLNRNRLTVSFTGSSASYETLCKTLSRWVGQMRDEPVRDAPIGFAAFDAPPREGLAAPLQVAFCAAAMPAPHFSDPLEPLMSVGTRMVSLGHLLPEIRFRGNAYGAGCNYDGLTGTFTLHSYRDPQIVPTLEIFSGVADYVRQVKWTQEDVDRAIIGKAKDDEWPIRPEQATRMALVRHVTGQSPELRRRRYAKILSATPGSVKEALLRLLEPNLERAAVCVVSSREKLQEANQRMPEKPLAIEDVIT